MVTYQGEDSNGDYSIFVQKFNADGTIQGSQVMLEATGVTNGSDWYPQITAVGTTGEYVVTYQGEDSNGAYSVFVQKFNADGTPKMDPVARSSEVGTAYLVNDSVTVTNLASITGAADSLWNSVSITSANSDTAIDKTGLSGGTYHLYSADSAGNLSLVSTLGTTITTSDTITPMMLDLNGDGVHTTSVSSGVIFDVNADGKAEQTGWSDGKDGFLALDLNGDAIINDGSELFGEGTTLADGSKAKDGYEALKQYDENGDNIIDVNDLIFSSLQIWIDANVDGKTNSGELYKLEDLNVKSLDLDSQNTSSIDNGNIQGLVSNWTDTNDNSHEMVDVWFKTQEVTQNTISDTATLDTTATPAPTVVITEDVNNDGLISKAELDGKEINANDNGTYTVKVDKNGEAKLSLTNEKEVSDTDLNSIKASATSIEGSNSDSATTTVVSQNLGKDIDLSGLTSILKEQKTGDIDLSKNGSQDKLTLTLDDVLKLSGDDGKIKITGDKFDSVAFKNEDGKAWQEGSPVTEDNKTFETYTNSGDPTVQVKVEDKISDGITS